MTPDSPAGLAVFVVVILMEAVFLVSIVRNDGGKWRDM